MRDLDDLDLLIDLAEAAGEIALHHFRSNPKVWEKPGGQGPVSEADLAIDALVTEKLDHARPDYPLLSEESEDSPDRLKARRMVILDPIDGTRAFIEGTSAFAHSIAVIEDGEVCAGVVYLPALKRMYTARRSVGAWLNGQPIAASARKKLSRAEVLATRPSLSPEHWPGGVPPVTRAYRPSLAYRLCLVAEGRFDGMLTLRDAWEWDTAAGHLIAQEAGAKVTDSWGGEMRFNGPTARHPGCIVAPGALHAALIARRLSA